MMGVAKVLPLDMSTVYKIGILGSMAWSSDITWIRVIAVFQGLLAVLCTFVVGGSAIVSE
jgi:hypothetical protein